MVVAKLKFMIYDQDSKTLFKEVGVKVFGCFGTELYWVLLR